MNVALILAGGSGSRTEQSVPKQFISIDEKPIIIYTLEAFQKHPEVDAIIVSCISGWHDVLKGYAAAAGITKLRWVVDGGDNGQSSARNALLTLEHVCGSEDIVIIHDAVRPMISREIITDCIAKAREFGSGLSAIRCQETIMRTDDGETRRDMLALTGMILCVCRHRRHTNMEEYCGHTRKRLEEELQIPYIQIRL